MRKISGRENVEEICSDLLQDESNLSGSWCEVAAWPENIREATSFMAECRETGLPITVSGGLTGIAAGALPDGGAVVSTSLMKGISREGSLVRASAGSTIEELGRFLESEIPGTFYPPDPTEETATLGGTVSTDASGSDSYLYGSTRRWVRRLELLLPGERRLLLERGEWGFSADGSLDHPELGRLQLPRLKSSQPEKNAAGYWVRPEMDLLDLFIGSEGTLGLITNTWIEPAPSPAYTIDLAVFPMDREAFWGLFAHLISGGHGSRVRAVEMMDDRCMEFIRRHPGDLPPPPEGADSSLILRIEAGSDRELDQALMGLGEMLDELGIDQSLAWGGFDRPEQKRIREFRHALPESVNHAVASAARTHPGIHKLGSDGAVPPSMLREYYSKVRCVLEERGIPYVIFGHAGQGHLHANAIPVDPEMMRSAEMAMREIAELSVEMGGTVSAEHGLGRLKSEFLGLMYDGTELAGMGALRRSIDPDGLLMPAISFPGSD